MNLIQLKEFFADYSLSTVIIATIISITTTILEKKSICKIIAKLLFIIPFALGVLLNFAWESISSLTISFNYDTVASGLVSGGLSFCVTVIIKRKKAGVPLPETKTSLVILGLVEKYVKEENLDHVVEHIERVILCESTQIVDGEKVFDNDLAYKLETVTKSLVDNSNGVLNPADLEALALTVIQSLKNHKE